MLLVAREAGRLRAMAAAQLQRGPHFQAKHGQAPRRNKEDPIVMDSRCLKQGERLTTSVTRKHTQIQLEKS